MLEHRYGALLLSHLLTADPLAELGDDVTPEEVAFQASAFSAVDDILVTGYSTDGKKRRVSVGVRRDPSFVPSDHSSVELISSYLMVVNTHFRETSSGRWRLALAVASPNVHVQQVRELANVARDTTHNRAFRTEVARPARTTQAVRDRLVQLDRVVAAAAGAASIDTSTVTAQHLTWRLLGALRLRELRLEGVDETDRTLAVGRLRRVTASGTADAADKLFSRLAELVGRYASAAATKTEPSLRRDLIGIDLARPAISVRPDGSMPPARAGVFGVNEHAVGLAAGPMVRSGYISQVRRIAPQRLLGREHELAYLSKFCTAPSGKSYLWWRAEAWAGKSALLSSFVLDPPAGVRVVSFFITGRLAGQGDRAAFADVLLEQLLELTGDPMPTLVTDATRDAHFLSSVSRAAHICEQRGERLVLVVDGLDEDQGLTIGPDAHSIAAMLPAEPPAGMQVVVASRPNPPIPADVPEHHPLRDPEVICPLTVSPHADVVRQDAERELKRLLRGTTAEQDLLGLLTAAGGGLSGEDLAELTGTSTWDIEDRLSAVSGRTFAPRAGRWHPETVVYVLGHEELQQHANKFLGAARLEDYRNRLHAWAEGYRGQNWPHNTPEYLLRGYFRLLHSVGAASRMVACATDSERHDRMLDITGGDTGALVEITMAQDAIVDQDVPDLIAMGRLAVHRTKLTDRNDNIPSNLPGVWAQLGLHGRAEALARSISDPFRRVQALAVVVREVARRGDFRRAAILSIQAEQAIRSVRDPYHKAHALAAVARGLGESENLQRAKVLIGRSEELLKSLTNSSRAAHVLVAVSRAAAVIRDWRRAKVVARSISTRSERAQALCSVASELANSGDWRQARSVALSIESRSERAQALAAIARASGSGDQRMALEMAERAAAIARSIRNPGRQAWTLSAVAHAMVVAGERRRAGEILGLAERLVGSTTKSSYREKTLTSIARVMAINGSPDRAELVVNQITNPSRHAKASAAVASGLAGSGDQSRAEIIARKAESIARSITRPSQDGKALAVLSQAVVATGDVSRAENVARSISEPSQRGRALTVVVQAMAATGEFSRAEKLASSIEDATQKAKALGIIVDVGVAAGSFERAERVARSITEPVKRAKAISDIARAMSGNAYPARVRITGNSLANEDTYARMTAEGTDSNVSLDDLIQAESEARSISHPYLQSKALVAVARKAAAAGDAERVESAIGSISNRQLRSKAFASISTEISSRGDSGFAKEILEQAVTVTNSIPSAILRDQTVAEIAPRFALMSEGDRAETIARSVVNLSLQVRALLAVAVAVAKAGHLERAEGIILSVSDSSRQAKALATIVEIGTQVGDMDKAETVARSIVDPKWQAEALSFIAHAFADAGNLDRAEEVARSIVDTAKQAQVLTALSSKLSISQSRGLVALALTVGHWRDCLPALLRIEPHAVGVIAEELLGDAGQAQH